MSKTRHQGPEVTTAKARAPGEISVGQVHDDALGAILLGSRTCRFRVWAPDSAPVCVHLIGKNRLVPMRETERGYHEVTIDGRQPW